MIHAYFIGGPYDLTSRALPDAPLRYNVVVPALRPVVTSRYSGLLDTNYGAVETAAYVRHPIFAVMGIGHVAIYVYEGPGE